METTLRPGIDWVGAIDWDIRDFHSYSTYRGATYNSYLVRDRDTALVDCVKHTLIREHLERIQALTPLDKVKYLVCNHAEPDHASGIPELLRHCPGLTIVCDAKCKDTLAGYHDISGWNFRIVKTGDVLDLGERKLTFVEIPLVHWPDSMVTYSPSDKVLFSNDAFGQHYATRCRFADEISDIENVFYEAKVYYANIVMLYSKPVEKAMKSLMGVELDMVAPAHGLIWRKPEHIKRIMDLYRGWMEGAVRKKVLVMYDTMWQSTEILADAIMEGADQPGVEAKRLWVRRSSLTEIATEMIDVAAAAIGTATLNNQLMPALAGALTYISGFRPMNRAGFAFGSYGWAAKGGVEMVEDYLKTMNFNLLREPLKCKNRPKPEDIEAAKAAGKLLARYALEHGV